MVQIARVEIPFVVQDNAGNAIDGATIHVYTRGTTTHVTVKNAETAGSTVSQPLNTAGDGRINGWVEEYQSLDLAVSGSGFVPYTVAWEAVRADSAALIADNSISTAKLIDLAVTTAKLANGAVTTIKLADGAVTTAKIADGAVTANKIAGGVIPGVVPAGSILLSAASSTPVGFLLCNGAVVSRVTYASLYSAIGTAYNVGGEAGTTFRLPDFRWRFPIGVHPTNPGLHLGWYGGEENVSLTEPEMPRHNHGFFEDARVTGIANKAPSGNATGWTVNSYTTGYEFSDFKGNGNPHNNMPPHAVVNFIVKY